RRERELAEVARLRALRDVAATDAPPAHEILGGDQDASIVAGAAAGAARQAVELLGHRGECRPGLACAPFERIVGAMPARAALFALAVLALACGTPAAAVDAG